MTNRLPNTAFTKHQFSVDEFYRPDNALIVEWTLVNCLTREEAIKISFYRHMGFSCCVWINCASPDMDLTGSGRGKSKAEALNAALESIGVVFDPPLRVPHDNTEHYTPIESAINGMAAALGIGEEKRIVKSERECIFPV